MMKITKIAAISTISILLGACSSMARQNEGAVPAKGPVHIHNVERHGDFKHSHQGNSTAARGHPWQQLMNEINKK